MIENIEEIRKVIFPITWTPEGLIDTRTRCNITREEAGELFGVSRQTIYNIENGKISNPAIILRVVVLPQPVVLCQATEKSEIETLLRLILNHEEYI